MTQPLSRERNVRKYERFSDTAKPVPTYRQVLAAVPDFAAAARRLEELQ